jgi:hypothetical protein
MAFQRGDKIVVIENGNIYPASVLEKCDFGDEVLWWVQTSNDVRIFEEKLLTEWNKGIDECVCGAKATYYPNTAPGHSYFCDYGKLSV